MPETEQSCSDQTRIKENIAARRLQIRFFSPKLALGIAFAVVIVVSIFTIFTLFLFHKQRGLNRDNLGQRIITERKTQKKIGVTTDKPVRRTRHAINGHILFVRGGDLWQMDANGANAERLIDLGAVQRASRSPISNRIAYTLKQSVTETVVESGGTTRNVRTGKTQLLLADEKGFNSFLVHGSVNQWGWIPSSDLLWYETATLQQFFHTWEYLGDGNVWIFNPVTRKAVKFIHDDSEFIPPLFRPRWSPDGNKLMFVSGGALKVADRRTKKITKIFQLPYVGDDRGGPQPIPYFAWSPDSLSIYAIFSPLPLSDEKLNAGISLKAKHITALRFPLDGSAPTKLMREVPSVIVNEESYPRAHFADNFSKAIYPRIMEDKTGLVLAMYDLVEKKEYILLENPGKLVQWYMPPGVPLAWVVGNSVYILHGDRGAAAGSSSSAKISLLKINYKTGARETLASMDGVGPVSNTLFVSKSETLFFASNGKLYSMNRDGVVPVADRLGDFPSVEYYFE
jgi:hypothetical protein